MPFFDFHVHPGMKSRLAPAGTEPSNWQSIKVQAVILRLIKINISPLFADSLDSQASLHHLWRGGVNLFGLIIYSMESAVAKSVVSKKIVSNGNVPQLSPEKLQRSANGDQYFTILMDELDRLVNDATPPASMGLPPGVNFKFIRSIDEYDANDLNTLHAVLILEGSQNLFNNPGDADHEAQFFRNLDTLSQRFRVFAINPCHFQQMPIANHAFAMQFIDDINPFLPAGRGITNWGWKAILELYSRNILVDIKHMGWFARRELYRLRAEEGITAPLICSHAGLTGISETDRYHYIANQSPRKEGPAWQVDFLKKWGHITKTAYNMSTLGLYDEDIVRVLDSGGMIGISLDQRIIGFPADDQHPSAPHTPFDTDYISAQEADVFFDKKSPASIKPRPEDNEEIMSGDDADDLNKGITEHTHALYFLNQVLHILWVAKNNTGGLTMAHAMRCICIGSDLDGLVNPIDCCTSTAHYPDFKAQLLGIMSEKKFWRGTGFKFGEIDIHALLDGIFFDNAHAFLQRHFV